MKKLVTCIMFSLTFSLFATKTAKFELRNRLDESKENKNTSITVIVVPDEVGWKGLDPRSPDREKIKKMEDPLFITAGDYEQHELPVYHFMLIIGHETWFINLEPKNNKTCYLEIREEKGRFVLSVQTSRFKNCPITKSGLFLGNNITASAVEVKEKGENVLQRFMLYQQIKAEQIKPKN
jgi:hypothetical protein